MLYNVSANNHLYLNRGGRGAVDYTELANRVLSMLKTEHGDDPSNGHLTMDNWEWPTGVAL